MEWPVFVFVKISPARYGYAVKYFRFLVEKRINLKYDRWKTSYFLCYNRKKGGNI